MFTLIYRDQIKNQICSLKAESAWVLSIPAFETHRGNVKQLTINWHSAQRDSLVLAKDKRLRKERMKICLQVVTSH